MSSAADWAAAAEEYNKNKGTAGAGAPATTDEQPDWKLWQQQDQDISNLEASAPYRFMGRMAENLNPVPLLGAITSPVETGKQILGTAEQKTQEAVQAAGQGQYGRSALSAAEAVPFLGPMVSQAEQDIQSGNLAGLGGTVASMALPEVAHRVGFNWRLPTNLNPVEASAIDYARREGIPVNLGTATNNEFVRAAQEMTGKLPLTGGRAGELATQNEQALGQAGWNLAKSIDPTGVGDRISAGTGVADALQQQIERYAALADGNYARLRQIAEQNVTPVQMGTQQVPGTNPAATLTPAGMPQTVPVMKNVRLATDYSALQTQVRPLVEQLETTIPEAQRQASPGYQVLRQILDRPPQNDINTAIEDLSAIQNIARSQDLPQVRGVSKGLAASAIPTFRAAIDAAAAAGGPDAVAALDAGRATTRAKYETMKVFGALPRNAMRDIEPSRVVDQLTNPGGVQLLRQVQQFAPHSLPSVGRTVLSELVDDMTNQGDIRRAQSAVRKWNNMEDATKQVLFPDPKIRQNISDFVNLAEMSTRRGNPSGTATTWAAIAGLLNPKVLLGQLLAGKPLVETLFGPKGATYAKTGIPIGLPRPRLLKWGERGTVLGNIARPKQQDSGYARGGPLRDLELRSLGREATLSRLRSRSR